MLSIWKDLEMEWGFGVCSEVWVGVLGLEMLSKKLMVEILRMDLSNSGNSR